ncbi:MAG: glycosyltransferase [Bacteroidia bacterium]
MNTAVYSKDAAVPTRTGTTNNHYDLVVFCHLRWDFVYQRPQHIISRLAKKIKILLIEEPWHRPGQTGSLLIPVSQNLHVLQPNVHQIAEIVAILPEYTGMEVPIGWFYSASFLTLLDYFKFETVVYDCMDELSLFKGAPESLVVQERNLMLRADIVFTGGKSLYESKVKHHDNVYCFPSSVDREHFAGALNGIAVPDDIASVRGPIVGYFGVIDERIDLGLLNEVASIRPEINFVMIGPLAKIGEHDLPRQQNIHYLGMKNYQELPGYIKAFDIAMMPFALNDATKYISPTKTLEYMAAGKPIISTAIHDVVRDYSGDVAIVASAGEFSRAIDTALAQDAKSALPSAYNDILEKTSWDHTVKKMQEIIKNTVQ